MRESATCPSCEKVYALRAELRGHRVKCKCGARFDVPGEADQGYELAEPVEDAPTAASAGAAAAVAVGAEQRRRPASEAAQAIASGGGGWLGAQTALQITAIGLFVHWLGAVALLGAFLLGAVDQVMEFGEFGAPGALVTVGVVLSLLGLLACTAGVALTLAAPAEAGRVLGLIGLGLIGGALVLQVAVAAGRVPWIGELTVFIMVAGMIAYLAFLMRIAGYIDCDWLHERAAFLVRTGFGLAILLLMIYVPIISCVAVLAAVVAFPVFCVVYLFLVGSMAKMVWRAAG